MTTGQTRVLMLLVVLFALEAVIHPGIKQFVSGAINQWNAGLSNAGAKKP